MIETICFATNNRNKLAEVRNLLTNNFKLIGLSDLNYKEELAEDFFSLEENAKQKAQFVYRKFKIPCFADDTGLEVEALNGVPGVLSARYAGDQKDSSANISLLLENMKDISLRKAQFRSVICLVEDESSFQYFEGKVEGEIIDEIKGSQGFGYDPVFVPSGFSKTLAEMSMEEKNAISHRAMAINKLVHYLLR
jgi:XTP/dITP diphosphohydrolase